jgi:hypothetical protein
LMFFLLISGGWVGLLYAKYCLLALGDSVKYNYTYVINPRPPAYGPVGSLLAPPFPEAVSLWDDPSLLPYVSWSPFRSVRDFLYQLSILRENLAYAWSLNISTTCFFPVIMLFAVLSILGIGPGSGERKNNVLFPLLSLLVYNAGYLLIQLEPRYIYLNTFLLMVLAGIALDRLRESDFFARPARRGVLLLVISFSFIISPARSLIQTVDVGRGIHSLAEDLKNLGLEGNVFAECPVKTLFLSYYLHTRFYAPAWEVPAGQDLSQAMHQYAINYYFAWEECASGLSPGWLERFPEITGNKIKGLRIYKLQDSLKYRTLPPSLLH